MFQPINTLFNRNIIFMNLPQLRLNVKLNACSSLLFCHHHSSEFFFGFHQLGLFAVLCVVINSIALRCSRVFDALLIQVYKLAWLLLAVCFLLLNHQEKVIIMITLVHLCRWDYIICLLVVVVTTLITYDYCYYNKVYWI